MCYLIALFIFSSGIPYSNKNSLFNLQKSAQPVPNVLLAFGNNSYYFNGSNSTKPYNIAPI